MKGAPDLPGVNECCKDPAQLVRIKDDPPFTTDQCVVCGCNHHRLSVDLSALLKGDR
jgi:hypothetical protein